MRYATLPTDIYYSDEQDRGLVALTPHPWP